MRSLKEIIRQQTKMNMTADFDSNKGTLFQIDFEVIKIMMSENFSFSFAENVGKFMILRRDIGKVRSFCKFCRISLDV